MASKRPLSRSSTDGEPNKRAELANGTVSSISARHDDMHFAPRSSKINRLDPSKDPRRKTVDSSIQSNIPQANGITPSPGGQATVRSIKNPEKVATPDVSKKPPLAPLATTLSELCNNILDLTKFKTSRDGAESRFKDAVSEYQRHRDRYSNDATKMEKYKNLRDKAEEDLTQRKAAVQKAESTQVALIMGLLKNVNEFKVDLEANRENQVSRSEFEGLVKQNRNLQEEVKRLKESGHDSARSIQELRNSTTLSATKTDTESLTARVSRNESKSEMLELQLGSVVNKMLDGSKEVTEKSTALVNNTKQKIDELTSRIDQITVENTTAESCPLLQRVKTAEQDIRAIKEKLSQTDPSHESTAIDRQLEALRMQHDELKERMTEVEIGHERYQDERDIAVEQYIEERFKNIDDPILRSASRLGSEFRGELRTHLQTLDEKLEASIDKTKKILMEGIDAQGKEIAEIREVVKQQKVTTSQAPASGATMPAGTSIAQIHQSPVLSHQAQAENDSNPVTSFPRHAPPNAADYSLTQQSPTGGSRPMQPPTRQVLQFPVAPNQAWTQDVPNPLHSLPQNAPPWAVGSPILQQPPTGAFPPMHPSATQARQPPITQGQASNQSGLTPVNNYVQHAQSNTALYPPYAQYYPSRVPQGTSLPVTGPPSAAQQPPQNQRSTPSSTASTLSPQQLRLEFWQILQDNNVNIHRRIDGSYTSIQALKGRMDNMTTEHLAQQMLDQLATIYPSLKDTDGAIAELRRNSSTSSSRLKALTTRVEVIEKDNKRDSHKDLLFHGLEGKIKEAQHQSLDAKGKAEATEHIAKEVEKGHGELRVKVDQHIRDYADAQSNEISKGEQIDERLISLECTLDSLKKEMEEGDKRVSGGKERIIKHDADINGLAQILGELWSQVDQLERKLADPEKGY